MNHSLTKPTARKNLGQHFLQDLHIATRIVEWAKVNKNSIVLEIGPGFGALTEKLIEAAAGVIAIEIDKALFEHLVNKFSNSRIFFYNADVTKCNLEKCVKNAQESLQLTNTLPQVVANLPYNISSPILFHLLKERHVFSSLTIMLQKEVVDRIISQPANKSYGYISVAMQTFYKTQHLFDVPPKAFWPVPKVWSSVVRLVPQNNPFSEHIEETVFWKIISSAFSQRRKMLAKNLANLLNIDRLLIEQSLAKLGISSQERAERLSIENFIELSKQMLHIFPSLGNNQQILSARSRS